MQKELFKYYTGVMLFIVLQISPTKGYPQESWSLVQCVNQAVENNIDLNLAYNNIDNQKLACLESKASLFPDLNAGSNLYFNFGRNIDGNNDVTFNQTISNNLWIQASVTIFQGLVKYHNIQYNKYLLAAQQENALKAHNRLIGSVLAAYYEAVYIKGLEQVALKQVELSENEHKKILRMVEIGKESAVNAQEFKSNNANDKFNLSQAQAQSSKAILKLKQLMRLSVDTKFNIASFSVNDMVISNIPDADSLYFNALKQMPEIKQEEFLLQASEKNLAVAKGNVSPRISLSSGFGTDFYNAAKDSYKTQITNNQSQFIRAGIVIPIFNGTSTYGKIKRNKIAVQNQQLQLEQKKEVLYSEICTLINDLKAAKNEYNSSKELLEFSKLSFDNTKKKLAKGIAGAMEYETAKQRLAKAEASVLKAKVIYIMRNQMLEFYKTGNWNHISN